MADGYSPIKAHPRNKPVRRRYKLLLGPGFSFMKKTKKKPLNSSAEVNWWLKKTTLKGKYIVPRVIAQVVK